MDQLIQNLKKIIRDNDLTVKLLEEKAQLNRGVIQNILSGKSTNPTIKTLQSIAKVTNYSIDSLIGNIIETSKNSGEQEEEDFSLLSDSLQDRVKHFSRCYNVLNEALLKLEIELPLEKLISLAYELFCFSFLPQHEFDILKSPLADRFIDNLLVKEGIIKDKTSQKPADKLQLEESPFSQREKEVLLTLSMGKTAKEAARLLNLSPRTIEFYLNNLKHKTGAHNKLQLINFFYGGQSEEKKFSGKSSTVILQKNRIYDYCKINNSFIEKVTSQLKTNLNVSIFSYFDFLPFQNSFLFLSSDVVFAQKFIEHYESFIFPLNSIVQDTTKISVYIWNNMKHFVSKPYEFSNIHFGISLFSSNSTSIKRYDFAFKEKEFNLDGFINNIESYKSFITFFHNKCFNIVQKNPKHLLSYEGSADAKLLTKISPKSTNGNKVDELSLSLKEVNIIKPGVIYL